jgi:two-component system chemotaxis response regulator CheY
MPRMDGMDLIRAIRRDYNDIYVILITAFGTPDTEKQAMRIGANDYLAKPFDFEELERRVRSFFQSRAKPA